MGKKFGAFLAGGLAGAALALLYAPRSGRETRSLVTEKVGAAWGEAQDFGLQAAEGAQQVYQEVSSKGQEFAQTATAKGQEFVQNATSKGQEVAQDAAVKGREVAQDAAVKTSALAQDAVVKGREVAQGAAAKGQEIYGAAAARVQNAAEQVKPAFSDHNDELREKIEAARQRIAAQVMKNAEESRDAAADKIDAEPEIEVEVEAVPVTEAEAAEVAGATEAAEVADPEQNAVQ